MSQRENPTQDEKQYDHETHWIEEEYNQRCRPHERHHNVRRALAHESFKPLLQGIEPLREVFQRHILRGVVPSRIVLRQ